MCTDCVCILTFLILAKKNASSSFVEILSAIFRKSLLILNDSWYSWIVTGEISEYAVVHSLPFCSNSS